MFEVWKDVVGYEGLYQISNLGKVVSLNWRNQGVSKEMYLKPHNQGYLQVELYKNGIRKMYTVHRLVAIAFVDGYRDGFVVNHKDENKQNNAASNLEWCSFDNNVRYSTPDKGTPRSHYPRKIVQKSLSGEAIRIWDSAVCIKTIMSLNEWPIRECCKGNRKTAYGYLWQYAT